MILTPSELQFLEPASGYGDIAYAIGQSKRWVLGMLRVHFRRAGGTGTEVATMTLDIDSDRGQDWDCRLFTLTPDVGNGVDVNLCPTQSELPRWTFEPYHKLVVNWVNPDPVVTFSAGLPSDGIVWGLQAAIAMVT